VRVNLAHNDNIKTFNDVAHHVKLEEDRFHVKKPVHEAFISKMKMRGAYGSKYRKGKRKGLKYSKRRIEASSNGYKRKRRKRGSKKSKNMNCFNCGKPGHFARDYNELKVTFNHNHLSNLYITNCLVLAESIFFLYCRFRSNHIARDRIAFVEFC
jgi:hypothetical protein